MKTIPINLLNHYKQQVTTLCQIFKLTLRDGTVLGFTSFDQDIEFTDEPGVIYKAYSGMTPTAISSTNAFNVDNLDVEGYLEDDRITESDLKSGKYDFSDVLIAELNWNDKPYSTAKLNIKRVGKLGEVRIEGGKFLAEIRGLMQYLQNNIGSLYQTTCRAVLGDAKCGVNLASYTYASSVSAISLNRIITCDLTNSDSYFNSGSITFTSGLNTGLSLEVKSWNAVSHQLELQLPANYVIAVGDTFTAVRGCSKSITECQDVFGNAINFRGEPYIPQTETLIRQNS